MIGQGGNCPQATASRDSSDSRAMPRSPKAKVGYNVQATTDDLHLLIVEQDVTNQVNDMAQLRNISKGAKAVILGVFVRSGVIHKRFSAYLTKKST